MLLLVNQRSSADLGLPKAGWTVNNSFLEKQVHVTADDRHNIVGIVSNNGRKFEQKGQDQGWSCLGEH